MSALNIEWFDQQHTRIETRPTLGLQKRGTATLNKAAIEALGNPEALLVGFDRARRVIAIKGTKLDVRGAYTVRRVGASTTVILSLRSFAAKYGIAFGDVKRYVGRLDKGVLLFPLEDANNAEIKS